MATTASAGRLPCGGTPYEDVARVLRPYDMTETQEAIARDLATLFSYNNPNFDTVKFLAACGLEPEQSRILPRVPRDKEG